jgi:hypothetical protein
VEMLAACEITPVSAFLASTGAFGPTAPVGSEITPVIEPRSVCANVASAKAKKSHRYFADRSVLPRPSLAVVLADVFEHFAVRNPSRGPGLVDDPA